MTDEDDDVDDAADGDDDAVAAVEVLDNFHLLEYSVMSLDQSIRWMDDVRPSVNLYHGVLLLLLRLLQLLNRMPSVVHNRRVHCMWPYCIREPM